MQNGAPFSFGSRFMVMKNIILSGGVFAGLLVAVNLHFADLGETYVTRNLFAWGFIALCAAVVWWQPLRSGRVFWQKDWLIGLGLPVIGAVLVLFINIVGGFEDYHLGHYFMPGMLLLLALLVFGLLQHGVSDDLWAKLLIAGSLAFLPQYIVHLVATNPVVFFPITIELKRLFYKEFAGFGQYNLYGSFLASVLLLLFWAATSLSVSLWQRVTLLALLFFYALDIPSLPSKTGLIGLAAGVVFLGGHLYQNRADRVLLRRSAIAAAVFIVSILIAGAFILNDLGQVSRSTRWTMEGNSVQTRFAMWVIAWRSFLEAPLFGHGLASYTQVYTEHFGRYGLAEGLAFYPTVSLPHNLLMHLLSETGLVGTMLLLGPFVYLGVRIIRQQPSRWVALALCAPVLVHTQLEYPYIASGMHYLVLIIGLTAAMHGRAVLSESWQFPSMPRHVWLGRSAICAVSLCALMAIANMQLTVYRTAQNFAADIKLPLPDFIETRYARPDVSHPIIGQRMRAMSDLVMARMAIEAGEFTIVRDVVLPSLEQNVLPIYNNVGVWDVAIRSYYGLGEIGKAYSEIERIGKYEPQRAVNYRRALDDLVNQMDKPTIRPR